MLDVYNSSGKHCLNLMNLLNDMKEIKKIELRLSNNSGKKEKYIKIIGTYLMRNYQLSKINNKDLLSKSLFW